MFITVKYGADQQQIFNPHCKNYVLLRHIKQACCCIDDVALSDEHGFVKDVHKNLLDYGSEYLRDRETLVLLRIDKEDEKCLYYPLLQSVASDQEFISRLNPKPSSRSATRSRRGGPRGGSGSDATDDESRTSHSRSGRRTSVTKGGKTSQMKRTNSVKSVNSNSSRK